MPTKSLKPCTYAGCSELIPRGTQYCAKHQAKVYAEYDKRERTPERKARYSGSWEVVRKRYLREHPYCEICYSQGAMVPATLVHHVLPLAEGGKNEPANFQSLCKSCHSALHAARGDYFSKKPSKSPL